MLAAGGVACPNSMLSLDVRLHSELLCYKKDDEGQADGRPFSGPVWARWRQAQPESCRPSLALVSPEQG